MGKKLLPDIIQAGIIQFSKNGEELYITFNGLSLNNTEVGLPEEDIDISRIRYNVYTA